jgi:hypothetical protein
MFRQPRPQRGHPPGAGVALTLPEPMEMGTLVVRTATGFVRRNPIVSATYFSGLLLLLIIGNGIPLTIEQSRKYNRIMDSIDLQAEYDATQVYWQSEQMYRQTRGWFGWSCDSTCQRWKKRRDKSLKQLEKIRAEGAARTSDAKSIAGIWSEVGVSELKDSFWTYFTAGKKFAQRQSMWDLMWISMRSMTRGRDESTLEFFLKVLLQVLLNFSAGLIMCLVFFVTSLYSIITSYQANVVVSLLTFLGASAAAFAFVSTYLLAVYGAAATGVYGILKVAETAGRAQLGDQERQRRMEWNQQRPHHD